LDLDFTTGVLDPRITFIRTSMATMFDATGKLVYAPHNLIPFSQSFSNVGWLPTNGTKTPGVTDPLGGSTACTFTATVASGSLNIAPANAIPGVSFKVSLWIRRRTGTGAVYFRAVENVNTPIVVTSTWQKFTLDAVASSTPLRCGVALLVPGDEVDVAFAEAQYTALYQAQPYNVTPSLSFYFGPRFTYDPATLAAQGLLLEDTRTNSIPNSMLVGGVAPNIAPTGWSYAVSTLTGTTTTYAYGVEDGMPYVDITMTGTNATGASAFPTWTFGQVAAANGQAWTGSVFVRKIAGATSLADWISALRFRDGASSLLTQQSSVLASVASLRTSRTTTSLTAVNAATAFVSYSLTATVLAGASLDITLRVSLPQLELSAFATSPIPTFGTAVTRAIDSATMTGVNFSSWWNAAGGCYYVESVGANADALFPAIFCLGMGATTNTITVYNTNTATSVSEVAAGGVAQAQLAGGGSVPSTSIRKVAFRAFTNDAAHFSQGLAGGTDTSVTLPVNLDRLSFNSWSARGTTGTGALALRRFRFTSNNLSAAELQALAT
jgi:hypothetical protein